MVKQVIHCGDGKLLPAQVTAIIFASVRLRSPGDLFQGCAAGCLYLRRRWSVRSTARELLLHLDLSPLVRKLVAVMTIGDILNLARWVAVRRPRRHLQLAPAVRVGELPAIVIVAAGRRTYYRFGPG